MTTPVVLNPALAMTELSLGGCLLSPGATATTLYIADTQFEHLSNRGFTHNPLIKWLLPPADRNVIATQTAALFVDELLRRVKEDHPDHPNNPLAIEVKGDVADTPLKSEIERLKEIIRRRNIPVEGYTRGNHSSGNVFGVVNVSSPHYEKLRKVPIIGRFSLDDQLEGAAEDPGEILNQQATMEMMHRILHGHREEMRGPKRITTAVDAADYEGYRLLNRSERIAFSPENLERNFETFWKPSKGTVMELTRERRFWDCMVNYDIADQKHQFRGTDVNPIYLQASETARFRAEDGTEYPVYTISVDGLDHKNLIAAVGAGVSELQVRLIETFMERMRLENPRARFKISSHFSAKDLVDVPWYLPWRRRHGQKAREAFRRLLVREDVILYSFGHTHGRKVTDLNQELKLGRKIPLTEINVPSLIDYHPSLQRHDSDFHDARALVVEELKFQDDPIQGRAIIIDLQYRGLDQKDIRDGKTPEVEETLRNFTKDHGYMRARETNKMLRNKHWLGWLENHGKRLLEFGWYGVLNLFFRPRRWWRYWKEISVTQYAFDNFTVVSTVNMFNEAFHLMSFLESVAHFIKKDDETGQLAIKGQILGLRTALMEDFIVRRHQFEEALSGGHRPSELKQYNDLFRRTRMHRISDLLLKLREGGEARSFALLAGLEASKQEFHYHKRKPTNVPNKVPTITIPL